MPLAAVTLNDKYVLERGRVFLNGTQALVRLCLMQSLRDARAGLNTAGYVTGYRGSPLGSVDKEFWRAQRFLAQRIRFQPAVNEDLAATAVWGTQQIGLTPGARHDGVFSIWYGKGPGVDRTGDVFRHANLAGTAPHGGVLALAGDDPGCKSSTVPSSSEYAFMDAQIPLLHPANAQEMLDLGLVGWALSRYAGCWVGMKMVADNVDTSASVSIDPERAVIRLPDFELPPGGLHIRWPDPPMTQEERLVRWKIPAVRAFARANRIDRIALDTPKARIGIVGVGKAYLDARQALEDLDIDTARAAALGLRVYEVRMPWPLEPEGILEFARGLEQILVIEEKRPVVEGQIKEILYGAPADSRPRVIGKHDESGKPLVPGMGELSPVEAARAIAAALAGLPGTDGIRERTRAIDVRSHSADGHASDTKRIPYFCAGCPHNTSTKVPDGSRAVAGIGCHYMAIWMDRSTATFTHMGGEGANWIGQSPFVDTPHVFVNLGDGTYFHSGLLAIRAAISAGVNITYKILYNDAVAMTGGQPMDGPLDAAMIARQVAAEGAARVVLVAEEPGRWQGHPSLLAGIPVFPRDELDAVQRDLREWKGVSVIVYDQTCAAEKRRRRKRGVMPDPDERAFINEAVCEGCGDCGVQSNCVAVAPVETELGRKRAIDQSACNKDFSCLKGFCPSFVTVKGGRPQSRRGVGERPFPAIPEPAVASTDRPHNMVVSGIGGTGVVTIGSLLGMAAHIEGKAVSVLDVAGLAQKNGEVYSHIRIAARSDDLFAARLGPGNADVVLGCDLVTAASVETLPKCAKGRTRAVVNTHETMTATFTHRPDEEFPEQALARAIQGTSEAAHFLDATGVATALLGDAIGTNVFMLGFASQKGLLPVSAEAIQRAIELNGVAVAFNLEAFLWGRRMAHDAAAVARVLPAKPVAAPLDESLDAFVDRRAADLVAYQNAALAARYRALVEKTRAAEQACVPGRDTLTWSVARAYFKLLAYKDEYEVARLFADGAFMRSIRQTFGPGPELTFHLAPPALAERDPITGHLRKRPFGRGTMTVFRLLRHLKFLRGTAFDPFGRSYERQTERRLITEYETTVGALIAALDSDNHALAAEIAALPMKMRGFGHVKARAVATAKAREAELMTTFGAAKPRASAAE